MLLVFAISAVACLCLVGTLVAAVMVRNASHDSARRVLALDLVELPDPELEVYGV